MEKRTDTVDKAAIGSTSNRLAGEKSPYLLQHADNPVPWYPWGAEAFEAARSQDKPVFLSIGYSTCHWCHVMEEESFEDPAVATLLNDAFVCIKVDREERPDIDQLYMTVCQILTGSGGWPLTIVMTPDRKPFFAGTYFPKESRVGRPGLMELVPWLKQAWAKKRLEMLASSNDILAVLDELADALPPRLLDEAVLDSAYRQLVESFDSLHGGFGRAPKFPSPHTLMFLLRYWRRTGHSQALEMVEQTLQAMRRGGIFDQVGFGFHRYATDREWRVPHFEKMLYDQALIAMVCTEAFQATRRAEYQDTARKIFTYVLRDLTSPDGAFYSAEDADSEGEEGRFYVWTTAEIASVLGREQADKTSRAFGALPEGNHADEATGRQTGANILHIPRDSTGSPLRLEELESARARLFAARERRTRPFKDDKILADWNGLMIASLARASRALDEPLYARAAERAAAFILNRMTRGDGRLLHRFRDGEAAIPANLDDYAFMVWGLLDLYETVFDVRWLKAAQDLDRQMRQDFRDETGGGFFLASRGTPDLLIRQKFSSDGAIPSGNSAALLNLLRLGRITGNPDYETAADALMLAFSGHVAQSPTGHTLFLCALDFAIGPAHEIVIAGEAGAEDTVNMIRTLGRSFIPNKVVLLRPPDGDAPDLARIAPFTAGQRARKGKATAYVCSDRACADPTTDISVMLKQLGVETEDGKK